MRSCAPLLLLLLLLAPAMARESMRAKCSACRAVADVFTQRLEEEVPRNHLDLRHRLDKDGKRYGKLIEYKMSELRVIHLLEGLCDAMSKFELVVAKNDSEADRWARSDSLGASRNGNLHLVKEQRKELQNYCHDLLERHEDNVSQALRSGAVDVDTASDFLCFTTAKHCDKPLAADEEQAGAEAAASVPEKGQQQQQQDAATAASESAGSVKQEL